jgi:hypothetical protein
MMMGRRREEEKENPQQAGYGRREVTSALALPFRNFIHLNVVAAKYTKHTHIPATTPL